MWEECSLVTFGLISSDNAQKKLARAYQQFSWDYFAFEFEFKEPVRTAQTHLAFMFCFSQTDASAWLPIPGGLPINWKQEDSGGSKP